MAIHPKHLYISLFSGAGGIDLAVRIALPGAICCGYVENEITAAEILAARIVEGSLNDAPIWSDVRTFPSELYRGKVAGIIGGFPCPDYSVAGRRAGISGKHGQLWNAMRETIWMVEPGWVFLENVPGITNPHKLNRWRCVGHDLFGRTIWARYSIPAGIGFVLGDLAEMGFDIQWGCLPASAVGTSHKRERWFALAYRPERGCRELRESFWRGGLADGRGGDVADARCEREQLQQWGVRAESPRSFINVEHAQCAEWGPHAEPGGYPEPREDEEGQAAGGAGERSEPVGDTERTRRQASGSGYGIDAGGQLEPGRGNVGHPIGAGLEIERCQPGDAGQERAPAERAGDSLGIFAPGPDDPRWQDVLVRYPWLRPAISQAEVEQHFRDVAHGLAGLLVSSRTDALRATGNGVVAVQGAAMLLELIRRAMR